MLPIGQNLTAERVSRCPDIYIKDRWRIKVCLNFLLCHLCLVFKDFCNVFNHKTGRVFSTEIQIFLSLLGFRL